MSKSSHDVRKTPSKQLEEHIFNNMNHKTSIILKRVCFTASQQLPRSLRNPLNGFRDKESNSISCQRLLTGSEKGNALGLQPFSPLASKWCTIGGRVTLPLCQPARFVGIPRDFVKQEAVHG